MFCSCVFRIVLADKWKPHHAVSRERSLYHVHCFFVATLHPTARRSGGDQPGAVTAVVVVAVGGGALPRQHTVYYRRR